MKKATITALKKSIATWERRAKGKHITPNFSNCALCKRFKGSGIDCQFSGEKCPVYEKTGDSHCEKSVAYKAYANGYDKVWYDANGDLRKYAASIMGKRRAQKEVDFLKSLLPE